MNISHYLTVMVSHGRTGLGRWILGSVTNRVVRQSRSLVLVVRAKDEAGVPIRRGSNS